MSVQNKDIELLQIDERAYTDMFASMAAAFSFLKNNKVCHNGRVLCVFPIKDSLHGGGGKDAGVRGCSRERGNGRRGGATC